MDLEPHRWAAEWKCSRRKQSKVHCQYDEPFCENTKSTRNLVECNVKALFLADASAEESALFVQDTTELAMQRLHANVSSHPTLNIPEDDGLCYCTLS